MSNWEEKIEKLAQHTKDEDIYILAGVPSWTLVLCNRILEITGKKHLREVWPNLELFMHGGVSFEPYRDQFKKLIPFDDMNYVRPTMLLKVFLEFKMILQRENYY